MLKMFRDMRSHRDLLLMITWRDIRIKYKQSVMGFLWAVLMPMLIVSAGVIVKFALARTSGKAVVMSQLTSVALKALPWSFFVASIRFSTASLLTNARLVTKIAFPRSVFPISSVLSQLFDFAIASSVVLLLLVLAGVGVSAHLVWAPVLLALLVVQTVGFALLLSAANLFFRDVKYIVEVFLTFAIFFTPVFYDVELFGPWGNLLMLNPVAPILEGLNAAVIYHREPDYLWTLYATGIALLLAWRAPAMFQRLEPKFAESV
jgi:homopolymeric O-antigen transport system permease protein